MNQLRVVSSPVLPTHHHDGMPVPCRRCGAPMVEDSPWAAVRCDHCGAREALPADAAQRVIALRERLTEIRAIEAAIEAPAIAIARAVEAHGKHAVFTGVAAVALSALSALSAIARLGGLFLAGHVGVGTIFELATVPLRSAVFFSVLTAGSMVALRRYAVELRPALEARPATAGSEHACGCCGGPIAAGARDGAFVVCPYCSASNLLGPTGAAAHAAALDRELEEQRARARGEQPRLARATARYQRHALVVAASCIVANVVFGWLISVVAYWLPFFTR
jgi:uncharacterized Zn finger protein (UPF0148 family)